MKVFNLSSSYQESNYLENTYLSPPVSRCIDILEMDSASTQSQKEMRQQSPCLPPVLHHNYHFVSQHAPIGSYSKNSRISTSQIIFASPDCTLQTDINLNIKSRSCFEFSKSLSMEIHNGIAEMSIFSEYLVAKSKEIGKEEVKERHCTAFGPIITCS